MRVIDSDGNDDLYFMHSDHLGSASVMSHSNGSVVADSLARHYPFGGWRVEPTAGLTDQGFTGHKQNDDLGLIFMQARYYVPGIGRFASADTIVPDPMNPQQFNRYTYVLNNSLNLIDPSGHCAFELRPDGSEGNTISKFDCTVGDFQALSWEQRKKWMQAFIDLYGLDDWFNDILGAIDALSSDPDYARFGGWAAYMDAAILQAINDGMRLYEGKSAVGANMGGNRVHGGAGWNSFFAAFYSWRRAGKLEDHVNPVIVIRLAAEQGGVNYARGLPETQRRFNVEDRRVQIQITWFLDGADAYRSIGQACRANFSCRSDYTDPRYALDTAALQTAARLPRPVSYWTHYSMEFAETLLYPLSPR